MGRPFFHLAQVNVARMAAPLDSPVMADFVAQLPAVNAMADRAPGFVWRLETAAGDATALQPYDDPMMLVNMSLWESLESLQEFTYRAGHREVFRDRARWFEKPAQAHMAIWWTPAGHIPSVQEAVQRLEFRRRFGDCPAAFSFAHPSPVPDAPPDGFLPLPFHFNGRRLASVSNTPNGDVDGQTRFHYRQAGSRVWATYEGCNVRFGALVAVADPQGRLDMRYHHVAPDCRFRTGTCLSTPQILPGGRLRLVEQWRWTNGDCSTGESIVEEMVSI
jgi:hypothetical protein